MPNSQRMYTWTFVLRWPHDMPSHHSAGAGFINYVCEEKCSNVADAKAKGEEWQKWTDLGFLELLITKGSPSRNVYSSCPITDVGVMMATSSSIYRFPSRKYSDAAKNGTPREWERVASKGGAV